jgi:hypothetical protein
MFALQEATCSDAKLADSNSPNFRSLTMYIIETAEELAAVSGGKITCTVAIKNVSCTGSAQEWGDVIFGAFDTLQSWGGALGRSIYDWTH